MHRTEAFADKSMSVLKGQQSAFNFRTFCRAVFAQCCSESSFVLSVALRPGCSGFYCVLWTYDPCSVICVRAASAAITPRLNPFAVITG